MTPTPPTTPSKIIRAVTIAIDVIFVVWALWFLFDFLTLSFDLARVAFAGGSFNATPSQAFALFLLAVVGALRIAYSTFKTTRDLVYRALFYVTRKFPVKRL